MYDKLLLKGEDEIFAMTWRRCLQFNWKSVKAAKQIYQVNEYASEGIIEPVNERTNDFKILKILQIHKSISLAC